MTDHPGDAKLLRAVLRTEGNVLEEVSWPVSRDDAPAIGDRFALFIASKPNLRSVA